MLTHPVDKPILVVNPIRQNDASFKIMNVIAENLIEKAGSSNMNTWGTSSLCKRYHLSDLESPPAILKRRAIEHLNYKGQVSYIISLSASVYEPEKTSGLFVEYNGKRPGGFEDAKFLYGCIEQSWVASGSGYSIHGNRMSGEHIKAMGGFENFLYDSTLILNAAVKVKEIKDEQRGHAIDALRNAVDAYRNGRIITRFDGLVGSALAPFFQLEPDLIELIQSLATNYGTSATLFVKDVQRGFIPSLTIWLGNYNNSADRSAMEQGTQNYVNGIMGFLTKTLGLKSD